MSARSHAQIARVAICAVVAAAAIGCRSTPKDDVVAPAAKQTPVPAPDGLVAEATIATPDATWQKLQRGVGGAAGILPSILGGIVCAASGIDPGLGGEIDGTSAAYVVVAANPGDATHHADRSWVVVMRLVDARRTRALVEGETSRFDARTAGDFELLVPKGARPETLASRPVAAIARNGGWFVVAKSEDDLARLVPYATRTMATRTPAASGPEAIAIDVPGAALAGAVRAEVAREWDDTKKQMLASDRDLRAQHGGRAPDFGDPGAIVSMVDGSMQSRLAVLADLKSVHVGIDVRDDDLRAVVTASPASVAGAASRVIAGIHSGDLAPLRAVTRDAGFALLVRDGADTRAKDAADLEAAIDAALGPRLAPADSKRVHGAIDDWTAARGDAWTLALAWGASDHGFVVDAQAGDPARAARAVHDAVDAVARVPAFREPLSAWLGARDVAFGTADVPGDGRAQTARLTPSAPASPAGSSASATSSSSSSPSPLSHATTPPPYVLAWRPGTDDVKIALAEAPLPLLAPSLPGATLGDDPAMRALMDALGEVAGAVVLQPSRSAACDREPGGIVLGWGRRDVNGAASMWGEAVVSDAALRCLAKSAL